LGYVALTLAGTSKRSPQVWHMYASAMAAVYRFAPVEALAATRTGRSKRPEPRATLE
jgi:hypothetical protein